MPEIYNPASGVIRLDGLEVPFSVERTDMHVDLFDVPQYMVRSRIDARRQSKYLKLRPFMQTDPEFFRGRHIVDFGCDSGIVARILFDMFGDDFSYTGIEKDPKIVPELPDQAKASGSQNVRFHHPLDVEQAPRDLLQEGSADVFLYFEMMRFGLDRTADWLKPGGTLVYRRSYGNVIGRRFLEMNERVSSAGFSLQQLVWQEVAKRKGISRYTNFIYQKD